MRKTILTMLVASAIAAVTAQAAVASERHHTRTTDRVAAEQFRQRNAAFAYVPAEPDYSHYNAGMSAPAGR